MYFVDPNSMSVEFIGVYILLYDRDMIADTSIVTIDRILPLATLYKSYHSGCSILKDDILPVSPLMDRDELDAIIISMLGKFSGFLVRVVECRQTGSLPLMGNEPFIGPVAL
jgi:hypothetical protein